MSDLYTFIDCSGNFEFTVTTKFLRKCPNPTNWDVYDLNTRFHMPEYLHNPTGPAIKYLTTGNESYWLNGKCLDGNDPEVAKKIKHNYMFSGKLEELIDD